MKLAPDLGVTFTSLILTSSLLFEAVLVTLCELYAF